MTDELRPPELKPCPCGGGYSPQIKTVRIPGTYLATATVVFCMDGCHHEGVGMTRHEAIAAWNRRVAIVTDPEDEGQVELVAAIAYAWSFGQHNGGADWERTKAAAHENGGFSNVIVDRCYGQARDQLRLLRDAAKGGGS